MIKLFQQDILTSGWQNLLFCCGFINHDVPLHSENPNELIPGMTIFSILNIDVGLCFRTPWTSIRSCVESWRQGGPKIIVPMRWRCISHVPGKGNCPNCLTIKHIFCYTPTPKNKYNFLQLQIICKILHMNRMQNITYYINQIRTFASSPTQSQILFAFVKYN